MAEPTPVPGSPVTHAEVSRIRQRLHRIWDSDLFYSFRNSSTAEVSSFVLGVLVVVAVLAPYIAPQNPLDLRNLNILNSFFPPVTQDASGWYILGSDEQGRDVLSAILYGLRSSLAIALAATLVAVSLGVGAGLLSGYHGGWVDATLMRVTDIMLSFPTLLIALLVAGAASATVSASTRDQLQVYVVIFALGVSNWPKFARTVRAATAVEKGRDYVVAARVIGIGGVGIATKHILPNVLPALLVIATLSFGHVIIEEATLSFLGVGLPPSQPSLGSLVRLGKDALFGGEWWVAVFPMCVLVAIVLSINLFGDWLRDAINPRLR